MFVVHETDQTDQTSSKSFLIPDFLASLLKASF
jgi:hypothetical protein